VVGKDIASNPLAQDAAIEWSGYWQTIRWRKTWQLSGVGIGKQFAGARYNYSEGWVLASNVLAQDTTIERSRYLASNALAQDVTIVGIGKQCASARGNNRGEWVLPSNALAQDATRCATYRVISATLRE
jgi:hypothetical protein